MVRTMATRRGSLLGLAATLGLAACATDAASPAWDAKALASLRDIEARQRITELIYRYAHAVRLGDRDAMVALFTENATFTVLEKDATGVPQQRARLVGKQALRDYYRNVGAGQVTPLVHDLLIEVHGDQASSTSIMGGVAPNGRPRFLGVYEDTFQRDREWLFTSRTFTISAWSELGRG